MNFSGVQVSIWSYSYLTVRQKSLIKYSLISFVCALYEIVQDGQGKKAGGNKELKKQYLGLIKS